MDKMIFDRLAALILPYTESDVVLTESTKFRTELGISSFTMMCLLGDIEDAFSVKIRYEDVGKLISLGDAVAYLQEAKP